ncbi:MAG: ABC transporter permease [Clostridiales bacterium]|nr:ABC transporter permease [Clostridiales bacterium]
MIRLIRYELKKLFSMRVCLVLILFVILANVVLLTMSFDEAKITQNNTLKEFVDVYVKNPDDLEAYMSSYMSKYNEVVNLRRKTGDRTIPLPESVYSDNDYVLINTFNKNVKNFKESYLKKINGSIKLANVRIAEYQYLEYSDDSFELAYQRGVLNSYSELLDLDFPVDVVKGYDILLNYNGFAFVYMVALIIGGMLVLIPEQSNGMSSILRVSKRGRGQTMAAKICSAMVYCVIVCVVLNISSFAVTAIKVGMSGANLPIQMVDNYWLCPFNISVLQGWFVSIGLSILSGIVFLMVIIAITTVFRNYIPSFMIGIFFAIVNYAVANYDFLNSYDPLKNLNFFWSITGFELIKYWRGLKIFGHCYSIFDSVVAVYSLLFLLFSIIASAIYVLGICANNYKLQNLFISLRDRIVATFEKNKSKNQKIRVKGVASFELKKVFTAFSIVVLLLLLVANVYMTNKSCELMFNYGENLYIRYMSEFGGKWSEEKDAKINTIYSEIVDTLSKKSEMESKYFSGEISTSEFVCYYEDYCDAEKRIDIVAELVELSSRLKTMSEQGKDAYFVDKTGWELLKNTNHSYIYFIAVILVLSNIFSTEYKDRFSSVQKLTRNYSKVQIIKYVIAVVLPMVLVMLCEGYQYVFVIIKYGLPYPEASSSSLIFLNNSSVPIFITYLLNFLKTIAILGVFGALIAQLSRMTKSVIVTMALSSVIVFAPPLLSYFGLDLFNNASLILLCTK